MCLLAVLSRTILPLWVYCHINNSLTAVSNTGLIGTLR